MDISAQIDTKIKALLSYESQFHELNKNHRAETQNTETENTKENKEERVSNFIKTQNAYWGNRIGTAFAEPFFSPEIIGLSNLSSVLL